MVFEEKIELGGRTLSLETGRLAKQADGAVLVRYGDTMVLVTTCITAKPREGMDFLRDEGLAIGCYASRYMRVLADDGSASEKSYGQSWWKSLAALERWAESHPTHVRIFGAAMKYLSTLGPSARLRLYHEVTVAAANEQFFEYLNCHPKTGMLAAVETVSA